MEFKLNEFHRNVSDDELLKDIIRVATKLNKQSITRKEYMENGGVYNCSTIERRFGGWIYALQMCGLSPNNSQLKNIPIPTEYLIKDLQRVAKVLKKRTITSSEYSSNGHYSSKSFFRKFGSWNAALKAADLEPFDHPLGGGEKNKVAPYDCLVEIERIWIKLGRQPTTVDIKNGISKYSLHTYERRFGSWRKALEYFVAYMNGEQKVEKPDVTDDIQLPVDILQQTETPIIAHKTKRDVNLRMRFLVMKRDNFKCCYCGKSPAITPGVELEIDHIVPWTKGGETTIDNLQTSCKDCNKGKSNVI